MVDKMDYEQRNFATDRVRCPEVERKESSKVAVWAWTLWLSQSSSCHHWWPLCQSSQGMRRNGTRMLGPIDVL